ncbi:hypothetical protein GBA52_014935 [Prunus armeniaca]|nr:hypothetical protein GBA52_014935 [Prunus armeniaca]
MISPESVVVQRLGLLAFAQETRVRSQKRSCLFLSSINTGFQLKCLRFIQVQQIRQVQVKEGLQRAACLLAKQLEPHSPSSLLSSKSTINKTLNPLSLSISSSFFSQKKLKRVLKRLETQTDMAKENSCLTRVATGAAIGGAIGGAVGSVYGTYEAIRFKVHSRISC